MPFKDLFSKFTTFTTKSGSINNSQQNIYNLITGEPCNSNLNPEQLVKLNKGWVSICNNKIANTCASIPIKLYYKTNGKKIERSAHKSLKAKELQRISKALKINKAVDIVEIEEHPFLDLLQNVNDRMNYSDFCKNVFGYLGLIGNSYVKIEKDGKGLPIALHPLVSEYVSTFADNSIDGNITRFEYRIDNKVYSYSPMDILQFINIQPGNNILGKGELENCLSAVLLYNYMDAYESYLSKNSGRPDFVLNWKGNINEKDQKEIYKQFKISHNGVRNAGKPIITTGEFKIENLGFPVKDLSYMAGRSWIRETIAAQYGVPLALLTSNDINLANALSAQNVFLRYCIYPKLSEFCNKMNEVLLPMYDKDLYIWFDEASLEDPVVKNQNAISAYSAGIIDKNECRNILGFEPIKESNNTQDIDNEGDKNEK